MVGHYLGELVLSRTARNGSEFCTQNCHDRVRTWWQRQLSIKEVKDECAKQKKLLLTKI